MRILLGHFDVPEKLEAIQKAVEAGSARRPHNYAEAAAKPKPLAAAAPRIPGPMIRSRAGHTLIISVMVRFSHRGTAEGAKKIEERHKMREADLKVSKPEKRLPTVVIRDALRVNTDENVVKSLRTQNRHIAEVLEVTPELYKCLIKADYLYVWLQRRPVCDQSPLVRCSRCLDFGHGNRYCKDVSDKCIHFRGIMSLQSASPEERDAESFKRRIREGDPSKPRHDPGQWHGCREESNPRRRKRHSYRHKSRKLQDWRFVGVLLKRTNPSNPSNNSYLNRVRYVCSKLETNKIILGSDVNACSVWWGSEHDDARGIDLCDFFDFKRLHILNEGNTPTFEVYRGDRLFRSVVDVTACSFALLDRAEE
ncbi:hypothetical protein EVAR_23432_1 [Eumeta japonica]|uniref:Endonuclease/exonuclease/phosphatase domain-containing protein n=1 Tax=Eumeta variegata TaxID=151549 RepID=A0A4C1UL20_EUMVA|nr:hypothetical protein EVAR_23432_1 [Eumeta japonica]